MGGFLGYCVALKLGYCVPWPFLGILVYWRYFESITRVFQISRDDPIYLEIRFEVLKNISRLLILCLLCSKIGWKRGMMKLLVGIANSEQVKQY